VKFFKSELVSIPPVYLPVIYLLLMFYKTEWFVDHKVPETLRIEHYVQHSTKQVFELRSWFH
jgi:hypothetical protein